MNIQWFNNLFYGNSVTTTVLALSLTIAFGILIGHIKIFKISLGMAGVLFSGLLIGHFGMRIEPGTLDFIREFGLILFVYTIGVQIGPAFFASFMKQGLKLNIMAIIIIVLGFTAAVIILLVTGLPVPVVAGIMSGAITNTPGLGAAQQALADAAPDSPGLGQTTGMAYAMCYPFGIFGTIAVMLLLKNIFRIDIREEEKKFNAERDEILMKPSSHNLLVSNRRLAGTSIGELHNLVKQDFTISRLHRDGKLSVPDNSDILQIGDIIHVVCSKEASEDLALLAGDITEIEMHHDGTFVGATAIVTNKKAVNKSVGEIGIGGNFSVSITKVSRAGMELIATPGLKLQFGDQITMAGAKDDIEIASKELGNSIKDLETPNILPIFLGIIFGLLIGSIPVNIPGFQIPLKLGLSGGALLSAIIFSRIGQIGRLSWFLPQSANFAIREIGITMFLACVGIRAGEKFFSTLIDGQGICWILLGITITVIPILIIGIFSLLFLKMNYLMLCGLLSGSLTDPPALSFATTSYKSDAPSITYATVYAMTMFLRIMFAQLLVVLFFK